MSMKEHVRQSDSERRGRVDDSQGDGIDGDGIDVVRMEGLCRGFLQNAAARQWAVGSVAPEAPTAEYLSGFADGWEAGHVAAFALVVAMLSGDSITALIEEAGAQAAVDSAFPFELVMEAAGPAKAA
jgi:hypothetical protein